MDINTLRSKAQDGRAAIIEMIYRAKAGHPGGSLSMIDLLTAVYETDVDLDAPQRSRVVLSKGHAVPAQYAILYRKGIIREEELSSFRGLDSRLQGHPHVVDIPQVDATTGLLGQGLSIGVGMALAKKTDGDPHRVYVFAGDGEMHEGEVWEALLQGAHYHLDNLVLVVDYNKLSSSGPVEEVIALDPLGEKLRAFCWHTLEIDGHDMAEIAAALEEARSHRGSPTAIVAHTVKGKGVSFMENVPKWHSSALTDQEYATAMADIAARREDTTHG